MTLQWLDTDKRRPAFTFYKTFMPHARITKKEALCVIYGDHQPGLLTQNQTIKRQPDKKQVEAGEQRESALLESGQLGNKPLAIEQPEDREIIAAARIRPIGHYRLLTGLLVHPKLRRQGLGHRLMQALTPTFGQAPTFLFCDARLIPFYQRHGFALPNTPPSELLQLQRRYQGNAGSDAGVKENTLILMQYRKEA
ncbi:GNAT family N-acetyltransferase [Shewanella insulae]|uniref:GNAT family N-acetyltransferase n=1 Tax=Shewanella insulae TaxID=2681496 RepID=UPI001EFCC450|nr:GNAT family N-acetyltransferase [Shewanella insulae]MCG9753675.1 GNAT family N-acetyltransferase [Shewanella insulae]